MTACGLCSRCGKETGSYDSKNKRWYCGCGTATSTPQAPPKIMKLMRSGRWEWIEKTDGNGIVHKVGVRRKSTGEERWF